MNIVTPWHVHVYRIWSGSAAFCRTSSGKIDFLAQKVYTIWAFSLQLAILTTFGAVVKWYGRPPIFRCMCRHLYCWHKSIFMLHKLLLNSLTPISGLTRFASITKRFYRELKVSSLMMTSSDDSQWRQILHVRENFELHLERRVI